MCRRFIQRSFRSSFGVGFVLIAIFAGFALLIASVDALASKAEGPFAVTVTMNGHHAVIVIQASINASNVELQLYGADGLEVQGALPKGNLRIKTIKRATLALGDMWKEEIAFTPGGGMSYLNVMVVCHGQPGVARAYSVGTLSEKQKEERRRGSRVDPDGVPIRLMNE